MKRNSLVGEMCAEFAGTMILILFGCGVVAQVVTTAGTDAPAGEHDAIAWAWGLGVALGVYVAARISGAHLNPAVTIALAAFKGFSWAKVLPYSIAQLAGAFAGAIVVRFTYGDLIASVDPGHTVATQGIFSTLPGNGVYDVSTTTAFFDQVVGTAILVFVIFALTTATNNPPMSNLGPVVVGLLVVAIGMAWGANAGYAINPARDLGPRLASLVTGYGTAMQDQNGELYFWLPIVAPIIGGLIGGGLFKLLIESHLPEEVEGETPPVSEPQADLVSGASR
ncbi:aquaporin family protein [Nocardioides sp. WL0053]|uniref:Aquaporin family protein n=1 Tax=Nocardioides jiangsuensis TaxID=2866161 RepID=A0ABS7RG36_9ACTN|nr:MIP/aquaporin family protein [Nocardioides jiangsuensis]MBY9073997.1 aquaporin family protein [Nocardioides jiangsuensis]